MNDVKWILKNGRLHCKHCGEPASSGTRGKGHSFCHCQPGPDGPLHTPASQVPTILHTRHTGEDGTPGWSGAWWRYLEKPSEARRFEQALSEYSLALYAVYLCDLNGGEKLVTIAARLGMKPSALRERVRRLRKFGRAWVAQDRRKQALARAIVGDTEDAA